MKLSNQEIEQIIGWESEINDDLTRTQIFDSNKYTLNEVFDILFKNNKDALIIKIRALTKYDCLGIVATKIG